MGEAVDAPWVDGIAIVLLKTAFEPEVKNISQIGAIYDVNSNPHYAVHTWRPQNDDDTMVKPSTVVENKI